MAPRDARSRPCRCRQRQPRTKDGSGNYAYECIHTQHAWPEENPITIMAHIMRRILGHPACHPARAATRTPTFRPMRSQSHSCPPPRPAPLRIPPPRAAMWWRSAPGPGWPPGWQRGAAGCPASSAGGERRGVGGEAALRGRGSQLRLRPASETVRLKPRPRPLTILPARLPSPGWTPSARTTVQQPGRIAARCRAPCCGRQQ